MGTLANSKDPDDIFHQGLHCLLIQNHLQRKKNNIFKKKNTTSDPSIYTMDHSDFIVCSFMENSIGLKKGEELLAIRRIFSLVDMVTNTKFSNCPNVFKIGVVQQ